MSKSDQSNNSSLVNKNSVIKDSIQLQDTGSPGVSPAKFSDQLATAWAVVEKSRHPQRPYTLDYLSRLFVDYEEIRGDRLFGEDSALVAGVGQLKSSPACKSPRQVFFLGHQKGRGTKQKIERNFGMAKPEGYRKACRVMEMAERFNRPLITFIDTPGAYPGIGAEERGQSEAIATSILKMFKVNVPTVGLVIGEGGSGGALAIGVVDRLMMMENSTYSVISPESCAAILWGNSGEAKRAALALKLSARDVHRLGICDEVIEEGGTGAHEDHDAVGSVILDRFHHHLNELFKMNSAERQAARFTKYRSIDGGHHA
jgi:acetyl-CoA carboxylase carboxyl transferase subunit alpha